MLVIAVMMVIALLKIIVKSRELLTQTAVMILMEMAIQEHLLDAGLTVMTQMQIFIQEQQKSAME